MLVNSPSDLKFDLKIIWIESLKGKQEIYDGILGTTILGGSKSSLETFLPYRLVRLREK